MEIKERWTFRIMIIPIAAVDNDKGPENCINFLVTTFSVNYNKRYLW